MAGKKVSIKINFDSKVSVAFVLLSLLFFLLKSFTAAFTISPTVQTGTNAFNASSISSYLNLVLFVFGAQNFSMLVINSIIILLLGNTLEETYGAFILAVMMTISTLFTGVLSACFCKNSIQGSNGIIFMLLFLTVASSLIKKKMPVSTFMVFALFIICSFLQDHSNGIIEVFITIAGGLCGSLFAFLASGKSRTSAKKKSPSIDDYSDENSPRFKNKKSKKNSFDDDETVVGTLNF